MPKSSPADLACNVLANNINRWFAYPDLFRAIVQPDGKPLPVTTALNQRLNERLRAADRRGAPPPFEKMHTVLKGSVEPVWYRMTPEQASAWKNRTAKKEDKAA